MHCQSTYIGLISRHKDMIYKYNYIKDEVDMMGDRDAGDVGRWGIGTDRYERVIRTHKSVKDGVPKLGHLLRSFTLLLHRVARGLQALKRDEAGIALYLTQDWNITENNLPSSLCLVLT